LAQVDLLRAKMARERVARRRDDHLVPVDGPRLVDDRDDQVHSGGQRAVVFSQTLDDHRLRLLHDADALGDDRDRDQRYRGGDDQRTDVVHAQFSLSTYRVAPSTRTTITRVPGSSAASMSDAARQSSPSTNTRPFPVPGSMRSETIPTLPASASTLVRMADPLGCRCRSKKGRMPTRDKRVPAAKLSAGTIAPGTTRETTPAARQPTATESSQKPGASISATNRSRAATSQTCHSCMGEKLARKEEAGNASSVIRHPSSVRFGAVSLPSEEKGCLPWIASVVS